MTVITISRQYGSGGQEIAIRLSEILGYRYFDKKLMAQMASELSLSENDVVDLSEETYKIRSFLDHMLLGWRAPHAIALGETWKEEISHLGSGAIKKLDEAESIHLVQSLVQTAYQHDNVVIMGRGGQMILKDRPDVLHVRLEAPFDLRKQRLRDKKDISLEAAENMMIQRDRAAAAYLKHFYDIEWSNPLLYHLVINTGKWDIETSACLIAGAVNCLPSSKL